MIEADEIMSRATPPGWHNLAIGEPTFLQEAMEGFFSGVVPIGKVLMGYPPTGGLLSLRQDLAFHLGLPEEAASRIVVANGARQALIAAMVAACAQQYDVTYAWAPKPFWPGFSTLAEHAGLDWHSDYFHGKGHSWPFIEIVTWPNNPSGLDPEIINLDSKPRNAFRIHDAVYQHEVYGYEKHGPRPLDVDVRIGSASKEFGLSGLRVGWAVFKEKALADVAASYVETTTSGVSTMAQQYLSKVLARRFGDTFAEYGYLRGMDQAKRTLKRNRAALEKVIRDLSGCEMGGTGMFAWFAPENPEDFAICLEESKVLMVDGKHCGQPGYFRANVGVTSAEMDAAVAALELAV